MCEHNGEAEPCKELCEPQADYIESVKVIIDRAEALQKRMEGFFALPTDGKSTTYLAKSIGSALECAQCVLAAMTCIDDHNIEGANASLDTVDEILTKMEHLYKELP